MSMSMSCHVMQYYLFCVIIIIITTTIYFSFFSHLMTIIINIMHMICQKSTYGPHSTLMEPTRFSPLSQMLRHSPLSSIMRPWKFSYSNRYIWSENTLKTNKFIFGFTHVTAILDEKGLTYSVGAHSCGEATTHTSLYCSVWHGWSC